VKRAKSTSGSGRWIARAFWAAVLAGGLAAAAWHLDRDDLPWPFSRTRKIGDLAVQSRTRWGASRISGDPAPMATPSRITVHHLGGDAVTAAGPAATRNVIKAVQKDHQERRGWCDIGYHYIVDRNGKVWEGRPISWAGAHAGSRSANQGNIGILVIGNFDLQRPARAQLGGLERLLRNLCRLHRIPASQVYTHRDVREAGGIGATDCPGRELAAWVDRFRTLSLRR
jgi:hypothetical protein